MKKLKSILFICSLTILISIGITNSSAHIDRELTVISHGYILDEITNLTLYDETYSFSIDPALSFNGRYIVYFSTNAIVPEDRNDARDIYLYDRLTKNNQLISKREDGNLANNRSYSPASSENGRFIVFDSIADNLIDGFNDGVRDVYRVDLLTGKIDLVSISYNGDSRGDSISVQADISNDGRWVTFESSSTNLVEDFFDYTCTDPYDPWACSDIYVRDMQFGITYRVTTPISEVEIKDYISDNSSISGDGHLIAYSSTMENLVQDWNGCIVYLFDVEKKSNACIVRTKIAKGFFLSPYSTPQISDNGKFIAFTSDAPDLVPNDTNGVADVFVYDRTNDSIIRVSVSNGGEEGNNESWIEGTAISGDGNFVTFLSKATNFDNYASNGYSEVFLYDISKKSIQRITINNDGDVANGSSQYPSVSGDGKHVAFSTYASNFDSDDFGSLDEVVVSSPIGSTWNLYEVFLPIIVR